MTQFLGIPYQFHCLLLSAGIAYGCDSGWVARPGSNSCYKFITTQKVTWSQAQGLCRDMKSRLATLDSKEEMIWMRGYRSFHPSLRDYAWIGGAEVNGKWVWKGDVVDSPILTTDWGAGEPNNKIGETGEPQDCLALFGDSTHDIGQAIDRWFRWDDGRCSYAANFICEKEG